MSSENERELLTAIFGYYPDTGILFWRERPRSDFATLGAWKSWNTKHAFTPAGTADRRGYRSVLFEKKSYKAHRLIWFIVHGEWPQSVDHIDGNPSNNSLNNLRAVTHAENMKNQRRRASASGATGVYFRKHLRKWVARIRADGRDLHLGAFVTKKEAVAARAAAQVLYGYHANHGSAR